jgi:hypothetical protein
VLLNRPKERQKYTNMDKANVRKEISDRNIKGKKKRGNTEQHIKTNRPI